MYTLQWVGVSDPDMLRRVFHSAQVPPAGWNRGFFADPEVDALIDRASRSVDRASAAALYSDAQRRIAAAVPYISLWHKTNVVVTQPDIRPGLLTPIADLSFLRTTRRVTASERHDDAGVVRHGSASASSPVIAAGLSAWTQCPPSTRCRWTRPVARPAASMRAQASSDSRDDCVALMKCSGDARRRRLDDRPQVADEEVAQQRLHRVPVERPHQAVVLAPQVGRHPRGDVGADAAGDQAVDRLGARRDALRQRADQAEHPPRRAVRLARGRRRVDDPDLRQRRRARRRRASDRATLPPNEWPTTASAGAGHAVACAIGSRTSSAQAATVCGGSKAGEAPCSRRSTRAAAHSGRRAIRPRAIAAQLRPRP